MRRLIGAHRASRFKRGARTANRADQGRAELEAARPGRGEGAPDPDGPRGGSGLGRHRSAGAGARALLSSIPQARALLGDRGHDADWFRNYLIDIGIFPCIPSRVGRKVPIPHDADLYRPRHKIENMFARLKNWRRVATRYDRCLILFLSACALAATVIYRS
jgi:transposase